MIEDQNRPNIGTRAARKVNFEEFFKPFADAGYTISESNLDAVCMNNEPWTSDNYVLLDKITFLKLKDSKAIVAGVGLDFNPEEYEQIALQLQEGAAAKAKVSDLEKRLQDTRDQLHGTKTGIKGLESQKETESKALEALRSELAVLGEKRQKLETDISELENTSGKAKTELETYIKDNTPKKEELETGIAALEKRKQEEKDALERFRETDKNERTELEQEYAQKEQVLKANLVELEGQIAEKAAELEELAKPAADAETPAEPPKEEAPFDINQDPEYKALLNLYKDRASAVNKLLSTLLTDLPVLDPTVPLDKKLLMDFYDAAKRLQEEAAQAGISERAEGFLNDLLGAVDADPTDEEVANPAYVRAFVEGVRECGFELYSMIASRNPEGMAYVLEDLADSKFEEGDRAAAAELTERAIALCKEQLPEDKEKLAHFEANLQIYTDNSE